ncbi:glycosyl hydrolase [Actinoplanes sp. NPDC051851]|uniref:glycosyl hydrolase n=1 Tax=Actinoplanes sp. NPDC051851 TaxID=3154753 RepID=UPI003447D7B3
MPLKRALVCAAATTLLLTAACSGDDDSESSSDATASASASATASSELPAVAPYVDIVSGTVDVDEVAESTSQTDFTLAFVLADSTGSCTPTWGGKTAIDDTTVASEIAKIDALGGTSIVSTGGETGTYLENACTTSDALVTAYETALDAAGSNHLDVDIEQTITASTVMTALAALQKARSTTVTLTLPVGGESVGLTDTEISILQAAEDAGVEVTVNPMVMNFKATEDDWGSAMTTATESVKTDVASVWTDKSETEIYAMIGVTPMIGINGSGGPTTTTAAQTLLTWAEEKGLAFVRFWSVNRDNGDCTDGKVASNCSGISQTDYAFTKLFTSFS